MSSILTVQIYLILDNEYNGQPVCRVAIREIDVPTRTAILGRITEFWESEDCAAVIYIDPCPSNITACILGQGEEFAIVVRLEGDTNLRVATIPRGCTLVCSADTFKELSVIISDQ